MARILLIDDDDSLRTALHLTLVRFGHVVIEARNGQEGLELFSGSNVDLLITDIVMPGKEGLEVLMDLREKQPAVKIIAMSGGGRAPDYLRTANVKGAAMVLAKPFSNEVLIAAVEKVLGSNLSESELRYRRLFESAHDGILIVDPTTRKIFDVNPFLEDFLGYTHEDFLGKELFEIGLLKDEAANIAAFAELQAAGHIRYEHLPLETKNGRRVDVEFVSNVYQEGDRQVIQCNVRDITVRKKTENALHAAELKVAQHAAELEETVKVRTTELRLSNTQLEAFVHSVAHDLRAPLRTLQGFAELLVQEHAANLNQEGRRYAQRIGKAAQTMDRLLTDLLVFSQISQQEIVLVPVELETVLQSALSGCETEIRDSNARIECLPPWPVILAHETTLRQALVNLIGNAVKYVGQKTPHVRLRTEERPDGMVRIWVEDNGIGIAPEFQEQIFLLFQRLHTTEYPGTGMGLALVQKGVERMSGHVGLVSARGHGSRFWIDLRKAPGDLAYFGESGTGKNGSGQESAVFPRKVIHDP